MIKLTEEKAMEVAELLQRGCTIEELVNTCRPRKEKYLPDEVVHKICQMIDNKIPIRIIHKETGVAIYRIKGIKYGMNYTKISSQYSFDKTDYTLSKDDVEEICQMIENGDSNKVIADKFGISIPYVSNIRHGRRHADISYKYNLVPDKYIIDEKIIRKIYDLLLNNYKYKDIVAELGVSTTVIYNVRYPVSEKYIDAVSKYKEELKNQGLPYELEKVYNK